MRQLWHMPTILLGMISLVGYGQSQIGADIGEVMGDFSQYSLSLSDDRTTMAIGAHHNNDNGKNSGHVTVYKSNSGDWRQVGLDINGERAGDWSGYSVDLSSDGSMVAVGAVINGDNGKNSGHVRVYEHAVGAWTQVGSDIDGEAPGDWSGYSLSLSDDGTIVAIGAIFNDGNGKNSGHVRVYKNGKGVWTQIGSDIDGRRAKDYFGASVSLSGDGNMVAIGAHQGIGRPGYVRVYRNISENWVQVGADIDGEVTGDFSGWSVGLSNDGAIVAIGAYMDNGNGERRGYVRVYQNDSGNWIQMGADIDGGKTNDDLSGLNVDVFGNDSVVVMGAMRKMMMVPNKSWESAMCAFTKKKPIP
ncbi:FG-GAP repeat protein [Flagellimonas sp. HMM57]|uniref:FG-GAP repeat protein n=1 Tax=Flagellimonas sp. HMM57 TaxID=2905121 RepID=UPI001F4732EC|nr:FG-GAP repeat protein [Flagellimonas sp. HMM57]UII76459.1 FG-GAP repeat protein [Flagellimonas sp. HMM57]